MTEAPDRHQAFNTEIRSKSRALVIEAGKDSLSVIDHVNEFAEWLSNEINDSNAEGMDRIACEAGCAWCCSQQVGVTPLQALHIAEAIRDGRTSTTRQEARAALRELDKITRGMTHLERLAAKKPCAFLKNEMCTIYEVRPYACRGANSVDAGHCRSLVETPDTARAEWKRGDTPAWIHALPYEAMKAVQDGLRDGAVDQKLPDAPLELTAAIRIALEEEDAEERLLNGDDVFGPARLTAF